MDELVKDGSSSVVRYFAVSSLRTPLDARIKNEWCRSDENGKLAEDTSDRESEREIGAAAVSDLLRRGIFFSLGIVSFVIMGCSAECCDSAECNVCRRLDYQLELLIGHFWSLYVLKDVGYVESVVV